ncbi:hypothetical protein [Mycolicibacterium sp. HK-90]|uniref:hypothetical protein n=1 Tax=Mycolicibacterium sp. HK-90 TaxID=3056937 RepID=UPI00265A2818|nr:hypothetical protein [Mycolicibacterium sp. HK-90]WKG01234.1 hypothetical protein QU592_18280 [Mycolicibacterium sp. HK-90]
MSEPVGDKLLTYTARVVAIRAILSRHLPFDNLVQNNRSANPIRPADCLSASWGPELDAAPTVTVAIFPVADVAAEIEELRYGADLARGTYEVSRAEPDEFALIQVQLSSVWVVAGPCEVYLAHRDISPEKLIEAAVEIARRIGGAPYTDDYEPPPPAPGWEPPAYR